MGGWLKYVVEEVFTVCCKRKGRWNDCDQDRMAGLVGWGGWWGLGGWGGVFFCSCAGLGWAAAWTGPGLDPELEGRWRALVRVLALGREWVWGEVCIKFFLMHTSGLGLGSKPQADPKPGFRETSIMNISRVWGQIKESIMSIIPSSPFRSAARGRNLGNPSTTEAKTVQAQAQQKQKQCKQLCAESRKNPRSKHKIEEQKFCKHAS